MAGRDFPSPFSAAQVDSIVAAHAAAGAVSLLQHSISTIHYDPQESCLRGDLVRYEETYLIDPKRIREFCVVTVASSSQLSLRDFRVDIISADGKRRKSMGRGDFDWAALTPRGGGIIDVDAEYRLAVVPGLRAGERFQTTARYEFAGHHGLFPEMFGGDAAEIAECRHELNLPPGYDVVWAAQGDAGLRARLQTSEVTTDKGTTWMWRLTGVPARAADERGRVDDPGQVSILAHVAGVDGPISPGTFAVGADWAAIARGYGERIGERMTPTPEITELAARLSSAAGDRLGRIDAIYAWVQSNLRYLGLYEGLGGIIPEPAADVLADGYGDCKGLGVLLISLLRAAGIDAWPALVRTSHLGPLAVDVPSPIQFNHFIVWADDGAGGVWLDATLEGCPAGQVLPYDAASPVLLLRPGSEGLVTIPATHWASGVMRYAVTGEIRPGGGLEILLELTATGAPAVMLGASWNHRTVAERQQLRDSLLKPGTLPTTLSDGPDATGIDEQRDFVCSAVAKNSRPLPGSARGIFLPRVLPDLPRFSAGLEVAELADREEDWSIRLPEGYEAQADSLVVERTEFTWSRRVEQQDGQLRLRRNIRWNHEAIRDMSVTERIALREEAIRKIEDDERGFVNVRRLSTDGGAGN